MSPKDQKWDRAKGEAYPPMQATSDWLFFWRKACDDGALRPYFYDVETLPEGEHLDKDGNPGSFAVRTWHGKPGQYMWRNHKWVFASAKAAQQKVKQLTNQRAKFKGGAFIHHPTSSSRLALPEEMADTNTLLPDLAAASTQSRKKRKTEDRQKR